jgi:hypothetical protein
MTFNSTEEVKSLINSILNNINKDNLYYNDLKWFSNVNYTTTSEYYGELKIFLEKIVDEATFMAWRDSLSDLLQAIKNIFSN